MDPKQRPENCYEPLNLTLDCLHAHVNGHSSMRCQIIDISDTGAKLMPADIAVCPREFLLKLQSGEARHCAVMWRRETQMGVHYT